MQKLVSNSPSKKCLFLLFHINRLQHNFFIVFSKGQSLFFSEGGSKLFHAFKECLFGEHKLLFLLFQVAFLRVLIYPLLLLGLELLLLQFNFALEQL